MQAPLVLLPGMMCDARLFAPQIAAFSAQMPVMVMPLSGENTVQGLASALLEKAPPTFALAGLSMGGIVAMEIMHQAPARVTRLALMDTNPLAEAATVSVNRERQKQHVREGKLQQVMRDELKPNYLTDGPHKHDILKLCAAMADDIGPDTFLSQSEALATRPDQQETLRAVNIPTLILCGRDDILCPVERHELMHALVPNSTLTIVEGAGHIPTLEQPEMTNKALQKWMT